MVWCGVGTLELEHRTKGVKKKAQNKKNVLVPNLVRWQVASPSRGYDQVSEMVCFMSYGVLGRVVEAVRFD